MAPMPQCPIPLTVLEAMRKIPKGTLPLISRIVDLDTVVTRARRQSNGKSTGVDGFPREFYKNGLIELLELLWAAINAYLNLQTYAVMSGSGLLLVLYPRN